MSTILRTAGAMLMAGAATICLPALAQRTPAQPGPVRIAPIPRATPTPGPVARPVASAAPAANLRAAAKGRKPDLARLGRKRPVRAKPGGLIVIPGGLAMQPVLMLDGLIATNFAAEMKGWIPVSEGAVSGRPELAVVNGQVYAVIPGAAGKLHAVRLHSDTLAPVSQSWSIVNDGTNVPARSAASCVSLYEQSIDCGYLTNGGAAAGQMIWIEPGTPQIGTAPPRNLGGKLAGAEPSIAVVSAYNTLRYDTDNFWDQEPVLLVWDGQSGVFTYQGKFSGSGTSWQKYSAGANAPLACDSDCYAMTPQGWMEWTTEAESLSEQGYAAKTLTKTFAELNRVRPANVPALAGGQKGADFVWLDYGVLVQVGPGNSLYAIPRSQAPGWDDANPDTYRYQFKGPWKKLGGIVRAGTAPSCVNWGEALTCAIQAADGRVYVRRFNDAAKL